MSGCSALTISAGVSSSKITTASTDDSAASTSARSCSGVIGRRRPLVPPHRCVGVEPENQRVAERPRTCEVADVAGVQQIEHAVGEDDGLAGGAESLDEGHGLLRATARATARPRTFMTLSSSLARVNVIAVRELPGVLRAIDPDVLGARLHAERVQQAMVVVRVAVHLVDGDVELVRPFDEIEALD